MTDNPEQPAPCGIVCKTCVHLRNGCANCFSGGGNENCRIRKCVVDKEIDGCWDCANFPCQIFAEHDEAWREMNIAFIKLIQTIGVEKYSSLARENIGSFHDYGDLRFKSVEEIQKIVRNGL